MSEKTEQLQSKKKRSKSDSFSEEMAPCKKSRQQDYIWQHDNVSIAKRDTYLLDNELYTDCSFIVGSGDKQKIFKCHRAHLARSSPVFEAMLFGELSKNQLDNICVPDVEPEAFQAMLTYLYSGLIGFTNYEMAFGLLYAAKKYMLPPVFLNECRGFIWIQTGRNVWPALEYAENNDEQDLYKCAWQIAKASTKKLLVQNSFVSLPKSAVIQLLQEDSLDCTEVDLFEGCVRWARHQVTLVPGSTIRQVFKCLLPYIRFLSMTCEEFSKCLEYDSILTGDEAEKLFVAISLTVKFYKPIPHAFCDNPKRRDTVNQIFSVIACSPYIISFEYLEWPTCYNISPVFTSEFHTFNFRLPAQLTDIDLPTQIQPFESESNIYEEDVTLVLVDICTKKILSVSRLNGNVNYNSIANFALPAPVPMGIGHRNLFFTIFFHVSGDYSLRKQNDSTSLYKMTHTLDNSTFFDFKLFIRAVTFTHATNEQN